MSRSLTQYLLEQVPVTPKLPVTPAPVSNIQRQIPVQQPSTGVTAGAASPKNPLKPFVAYK